MGTLNDKPSFLQLRRLGTVHRWGVVPTIRTQTVDAHSFQVLVASKFLFQFSPFNLMQGELYRVRLFEAIINHDAAESLSNDVPAPFKSELMKDRFEEWEGISESMETCRRHVDAADMLEAIAFLLEEQAMGNSTVMAIVEDMESAFVSKFIDINPVFVLGQWRAAVNPHRHPLLDWRNDRRERRKLIEDSEKASGLK